MKRTVNADAPVDATTSEIRDSATFYAGFISGRVLVGDPYYLNLARRVAQALQYGEAKLDTPER